MNNPATVINDLPSNVVFPANIVRGDHVLGSRTVFGNTQYLVYKKGFNPQNDPRLNNILGSGFSIHQALLSASKVVELENKTPQWYQPLLRDCHFEKRVVGTSNFISHCVVNDKGELMGIADGRETACNDAMFKAVIQHEKTNPKSLSYADFSQIVTFIGVTPSPRGGVYFEDENAITQINHLVKAGWNVSSEFRHAGNSLKDDFVKSAKTINPADSDEYIAQKALSSQIVLKLLKLNMKDVVMNMVAVGANDWRCLVALHTNHIDKESALSVAYANYKKHGLLNSLAINPPAKDAGNKRTHRKTKSKDATP